MKSAVLLIVFNRPDTARKAFEAIRRAAPPRIYIAADGPRANRPAEAALCEQTRQIINEVDWACDVHTLLRDNNLGCKIAVSEAINWFLSLEEEGIILEDDCLAQPSFFEFADRMLERYRDDARVCQISGSNFVGDSFAGDDSYFFSRYPDIWGWATWRRAWKDYDVQMSGWPDDTKLPDTIDLLGGALARSYWQNVFRETWEGKIDTWDYQWIYSCWSRSLINIYPRESLITNIGFDHDATHTAHRPPPYLREAKDLQFPLRHPNSVAPSAAADGRISRVRYQIGLYESAVRYLRQNRALRTLLKPLKQAIASKR